MALLVELHMQGQDKFVYTCNACKNSVETRYHCSVCEVRMLIGLEIMSALKIVIIAVHLLVVGLAFSCIRSTKDWWPVEQLLHR